MMKINILETCAASLLIAIGAIGCGDDDEGTTPALPSSAADAVENYADIVYASYSDSLEAAQALDSAVDSFIAAPSAAGLDDAKQAWLASREPYLQTEVYRFYNGPIDNPETGVEGYVNAWPLSESYIDYVIGDDDEPDEGMINDPEMTIDKDAVLGANEGVDETTISTGFHAIEFLLWGQDLDENGPGNRPYTDYVTGEGGTAANQDRRGEYLATVSDLLVEHLQMLVDAWDPDAGDNYRAQFLAEDPQAALTKIMSGMLILSGFETGGERLEAALLTGDQEDEHSCFSDNTHRDMVQDVRGVRNVWVGEYGNVSGPGVRDVIAAGNAELAQRLSDQIDESLDRAEALQPPFDREIAVGNDAGRARVESLSESLFVQTESLEEAFELYGLTPEPEPI